MCSRSGPAFGVIVVAFLAVPPATHASDERHSPRVGSVISAGSGVRGFAGSEDAGGAQRQPAQIQAAGCLWFALPCEPATWCPPEPADRNSPRLQTAVSPAPQPKADPLSNGIGIGAALGAGVGLGLMGWAYAQCDDTCDAPEPAGMYSMAAGVGAAIGAVVGLVIDAARKNTNQRVSIAATATPRHAAAQVSVRW